jgi:hypothetical protein
VNRPPNGTFYFLPGTNTSHSVIRCLSGEKWKVHLLRRHNNNKDVNTLISVTSHQQLLGHFVVTLVYDSINETHDSHNEQDSIQSHFTDEDEGGVALEEIRKRQQIINYRLQILY